MAATVGAKPLFQQRPFSQRSRATHLDWARPGATEAEPIYASQSGKASFLGRNRSMHLNRAALKRTQSHHKHKKQVSRSVSILARRPTSRPARQAGSGTCEGLHSNMPSASPKPLQIQPAADAGVGRSGLTALLCGIGWGLERSSVTAVPVAAAVAAVLPVQADGLGRGSETTTTAQGSSV
jgi:hypothetical protein